LYQFAPSVDRCRLGRSQSTNERSALGALYFVNQSATTHQRLSGVRAIAALMAAQTDGSFYVGIYK